MMNGLGLLKAVAFNKFTISALVCIVFILSYNACLVLGELNWFERSTLKMMMNTCIFGYAIISILLAMREKKSPLEKEFAKVSTAVLGLIFVLITLNSRSLVKDFYSHVLVFNLFSLGFIIYAIFKADKNGNI